MVHSLGPVVDDADKNRSILTLLRPIATVPMVCVSGLGWFGLVFKSNVYQEGRRLEVFTYG